MNLADKIRNIPNFPKPGIQFKDITTLLKDKDAYKQMIDSIADSLRDLNLDLIVGPEARGFVVGAPLAYVLGCGFVPVRKPGKLPAETASFGYDLEYGTSELQIHKDAIYPGVRVAVVDDLLATGGTALAACKLIETLGGEVVAVRFALELLELPGRENMKGYNVETLIKL